MTIEERNANLAKEGKKYQWSSEHQPKNKNGRKPKLVKELILTLKKNGYDEVSPEQVRQAFQAMFNLPLAELQNLSKDENQPILVHIIANRLIESKDAYETLERMLDRSHGKATQQIQHASTDGKSIPVITFVQTNTDEIK